MATKVNKFSEGGWRVIGYNESWKVKEWAAIATIQSGNGDELVILAPISTETLLKMEAEANAHLIAAAPDMYELLKDAALAIRTLVGNGGLLEDINKVIAKAEGKEVAHG